MSASLVGSEMCIRDRSSRCCGARLTAPARPAARVASLGRLGGPSIRTGPRARTKGEGGQGGSGEGGGSFLGKCCKCQEVGRLSLIHISEPTRLALI
eukprot:11729772-Alexandrium_andersonii.AAC.1